MRWDAFHDVHQRPFAVRAGIDGRAQRRYELLTRLAEGLRLGGAYAFKPEGASIRMMFEREADALKVAEAVRATRASGGDSWTFELDTAIEALILGRTVAPPRKSSGTRGTRRKRELFL
ncbi:MAG: hypothetical protein JSR24_02230 [Proteobacteria bacterium]|nr:hypothetical protein [Pseudomonadota bacterium]